MNMQNLRQQEWKWIISAAALVLGLCLPVHATTITVCPTGCDYTFIQAAIDAAAADDTINVSPNSTGYAEALTLDKPVKIIGKKSNKTSDAWTTGTAGSSGGPLAGGTLMGSTLMGTTISYLNIQYCTVKMDANTKGLTVDYGNTLENTTISYCSFTGPAATADADWFAVSGSSSLPVDGGAVNGITVTYNTILQATSELRLDRDIANITYAHNTFSNSNGYIKLSKPYGGSGRVQGINVTFNTFNNSTKPFADEYAVAVADTVIETDANGPWGENLAIHFNNFLQDDAAGPYPIVGFQDSSRFTSEITATHNWWNSTSGPRIFVAGDPNTDTRPDVSERAGFDVPALRNFSLSSITGGLSGSVAPNMTKTITDPSINVQLLVKTNAGSGKVFAAKYAASPVASAVTSPLPGAAYYDVLLYPSSVSSIEAVTATIYYPTGTALASTAPVYWYSGITQTWISWDTSRRTVSSTPVTFNGTTYAGYVTIWADKNSTNPPLNRLTGTPVALSGSSVSTTTTTAATTTSSAGSSTTTTAATTTTSIGGTTTAKTTSSTSSVKPTTTTTAPLPRLTINPVSLNYGADKIVQTFTITNTGPGTLSWNINKEGINYDQGVDWIFDITPVSGETGTEKDTVTVTVSRAGLDPGTYTATIPISSNGGDKTLSISMEVTAAEAPVLNLKPTVLYLKDTDAAGTVDISNTGTGTLVWKLGEPVYVNGNGINWISGVTPPSGSTAALEKVTVSISVNRDNLRGGIYIANIPLTSNVNVGNRTIGVVMFVARDSQQYPRTKVDPFILFLKKSDVSKTFNISNAGTGTLVWQLGDVTYPPRQQGGWITAVSPQAGEASSDADTITVTVDSSSLKQGGLYGATIPVKSNGGNRNVFIYVWVPLLQLE